MQIVCPKCQYQFERPPTAGESSRLDGGTCPRCGTALNVAEQTAAFAARTTEAGEGPGRETPAPADLATPRRTLGEYEILEEVSRGAMGIIYKARHGRLRRTVALKLLLAGEHASAEQIARFEKEARSAAQLRHPNIVPIYEIGMQDGHRYFTMDFVEGISLDVLIARQPLAPRRVLEITATVADALGYAHSRGVIHRDVKPSNIMLDQSGQPQVTDFGLAKQTDSDTKFTRTGTTIGTPSYMSPEQARGENRVVDHRSDIYSLGAVMYEMLAGRPPFTGETMMNIVMKVVHDDPVPVRRINARLHRDIQTIVAKAMEKDPRRRYQSMADLAADIRRYLAGEMITARPAGWLRRSAKALRKHRPAVTTGLTVTLLAATVSGIIITVLLRGQERAQRQVQQVEYELKMLTLADQTPEWTLRLREDFSRPLEPVWTPSSPQWKIEDGRLTAASQDETYIILDREFPGNVVIEFTASAATRTSLLSCLLGDSVRSAYVFRFGTAPTPTLALQRAGKLLAQVTSPPVEPGVLYSFRIERHDTQILCRVSGADKTTRLVYDEPSVLAGFGQSRFGFAASGSAVGFDGLRISTQEFTGERLNKLQSIEYYTLSHGQLEKALEEYESILENHGGKPIAVAAEFQCGLVLEALARDPRWNLVDALNRYRNVERQAALLADGHAAVAVKNQERIFFVLAAMGQYQQAADVLASLCASGGRFGAGTVWELPDVLTRCAGAGAFEPALQIMEAVRFEPPEPTLREQWQKAGPIFRSSFASSLEAVCGGLAEQRKYAEMRRAFEALPDKNVAGPFESSVAKAVDSRDAPLALDLLLFCSKHDIATPRLDESAVALAKQFLESKHYLRITNVHTAYPTRSLAKSFDTAVSELAQADRTAAVEFFADALDRFPQDKGAFAESADQLMASCLKAGQFINVRRIYARMGDPRFSGRLLEAAQGQISAGDLDNALEMIGFIRANVADRAAELKPLAADLAVRLAVAGRTDDVLSLFENYPGSGMADLFVSMLRAASELDNRERVEKLTVLALRHFRTEPRVMAATRGVLSALRDAGLHGLVAGIYEKGAQANGAAPEEALATRLEGAEMLLSARAYPQAAALYTAAGKALPHDAKGAAALLRAGAIYEYLADGEKARIVWGEIGEKHANTTEASVARMMTGIVPVEDFSGWLDAHPSALPEGEGNFYVALRLAALKQPGPARERLSKVEAKAWCREMARALLLKMTPPASPPRPGRPRPGSTPS